jgi:hypothetical protein
MKEEKEKDLDQVLIQDLDQDQVVGILYKIN